jgi:uncharacterized protein YjcR
MTPDPVGVAEIAERLGVKQQTAQTWRHRKLLPPPRWTVSRQPAWNWADVERWAKETGRI